jgi:hypothetical protein
MNNKTAFISDWIESNWQAFLDGTLCDTHGQVVTVADALGDMSARESEQLCAAFKAGACQTQGAIEVICKSYLISVIAMEEWSNHLAAMDDAREENETEAEEKAAEHRDMMG